MVRFSVSDSLAARINRVAEATGARPLEVVKFALISGLPKVEQTAEVQS